MKREEREEKRGWGYRSSISGSNCKLPKLGAFLDCWREFAAICPEQVIGCGYV